MSTHKASCGSPDEGVMKLHEALILFAVYPVENRHSQCSNAHGQRQLRQRTARFTRPGSLGSLRSRSVRQMIIQANHRETKTKESPQMIQGFPKTGAIRREGGNVHSPGSSWIHSPGLHLLHEKAQQPGTGGDGRTSLICHSLPMTWDIGAARVKSQ